MVSDIMRDPRGQRLIHWCWFFLMKYGMDAGKSPDDPYEPVKFMRLLRSGKYLEPMNLPRVVAGWDLETGKQVRIRGQLSE